MKDAVQVDARRRLETVMIFGMNVDVKRGGIGLGDVLIVAATETPAAVAGHFVLGGIRVVLAEAAEGNDSLELASVSGVLEFQEALVRIVNFVFGTDLCKFGEPGRIIRD